jgi:hypothetical protein
MKKLNVLMIALLCVCWSCKDDENEPVPVPVITLNTPADNAAAVDLNAGAAIDFTWQANGAVAGGYTLYLSNAQTLANALTYTVASGTSKSVAADELNAKVTEWGVAANTETTVWWTVKATTEGQATAPAARALKVKSKPEVVVLAITGPAEKVVLLEANETETAVTLNWNATAGVAYSFKMAIANTSFADATEEETITGSTKSFTVGELNELLVMKWSKSPGADVELEVQITGGGETATAKFTAVPYAVYVLEITGPTTKVTLLRTNETTPAVTLNWNAKEGVGYSFKMAIANTSFANATADETITGATKSFTAGELNELIVTKWSKSPGTDVELDVQITANGDTVTTTFTAVAYVPYFPNIYPVGDASLAGWTPGSVAIPRDDNNPGVYVYEDALTAGELKFQTEAGWGGVAFRPLEPAASISSTGLQCIDQFTEDPYGNTDNKWVVLASEAGNYRITIDVNEMKIYFEKLDVSIPYYFPNIYPVGDASPAGWAPGSVVVPWDESIPGYVYEAALTAGELKFQTQPGWDGVAFRPLAPTASISSTGLQCIDQSTTDPYGYIDNKWVVLPSEAGNYRITINVVEMKIYFTKL